MLSAARSHARVRRGRRRLAALALTVIAVGGGPVAPTDPASALAPDTVVCQGTEAIAFSPTLTFTPQTTTVTINDVLAPCVVAGDPTTTSATVSTAVTRPNFSCLSLFGGGAATRTFNWNDGTSSTFTHISNVQIVGGNFVVTLQGTITSGRFAGSTATGVIVLTANLVQCLTPTGLGSATGTFTLTIV